LTSLRHDTNALFGRRKAATIARRSVGSIQNRVLTRAQCALEVDHIIPENAHANAGKRDTDRPTFAELLASYQHRQET